MRGIAIRIAPIAAVVAVAACRESSGPPQVQQYSYAIFNADVQAASTGALSTNPIGFFFRAPALQLPNSRSDLDVCQVQQLGPNGSQFPEFISAGDSVAFAPEGGSTVYLKPQPTDSITSYEVPARIAVPMTAGATVTFTVPGAANGFPASAISIKTAEPYQITQIPAELPSGEPLTLTWTPAGTPTAAPDTRMDLAFMYATTSPTALSEQLFCSVADDGEFTVRAADLGGYRAANGLAQRFTSRRWRSAFKNLGNNSVMLALSSYYAPRQDFP